ncbi:MAG: hypothetical protein ACK559_41940 [bacterium]
MNLWELATGKQLHKFTEHTKLVNCVKFFIPKAAEPHKQYLFSCSDDGSVRLYDLTSISG